MRARELIDHAAFGPDALKVIEQAFDEAWQEIAGNFGDQQDIEAARFRLANVPSPNSAPKRTYDASSQAPRREETRRCTAGE
jgi:hypothetical protein